METENTDEIPARRRHFYVFALLILGAALAYTICDRLSWQGGESPALSTASGIDWNMKKVGPLQIEVYR